MASKAKHAARSKRSHNRGMSGFASFVRTSSTKQAARTAQKNQRRLFGNGKRNQKAD